MRTPVKALVNDNKAILIFTSRSLPLKITDRVNFVQASNEYIMYVEVCVMNSSEIYHRGNILKERP